MTTFRRLGPAGDETPAVEIEGAVYDLRTLTYDIDGAFLAGGGLERARDAAVARELPPLVGADEMRVGAPIARPPAIVCVGLNYATHAVESGNPKPESPVVFMKHPNTIVGPHDDLHLPPGSARMDWEVELGVVIGRRVLYLETLDEAIGAIAGYVVSDDVSEREWQIDRSGGQWSKGKNGPTFNPLGPWLVPRDEVDPGALRIWSTVNGEPRQDSSTADMIFTVAHIVHHLSRFMALEPGDLVNTGTPEGVGLSGRFPYLATGDVVEVGIEGLGAQRTPVVETPRA